MSHGVGRRCGSDLVWLCLWCWQAAIALIGPLTWERPYAMGVAIKRKKYLTDIPGETLRRQLDLLGDWIEYLCAYPPILQILMLKPNLSVMVFGGEAIQKQLSHGVGAFVMGLVTL